MALDMHHVLAKKRDIVFCIFAFVAALFSFYIFVCMYALSGNQYFSGSRRFVEPFCSICQVPQHARHQIESSGLKNNDFHLIEFQCSIQIVSVMKFCQNSFFLSSTSQDDAYVDIDVRNSIMTLNYWLGAN